MAGKNIRQRPSKGSDMDIDKPSRTPTEIEDAGRVISLLDVLRMVLTLIAAAVAGSYYLTSGESYTYGYKPWFTDTKQVKQYFKGPLVLTPEQLAEYDGRDPKKPIYMAINGTIFDVSASPAMYGPGGGYSVFSGRDSTRAFITGCFAEDRTNDMRGAELVYMPIDDPNEVISPEDRKARATKELAEAREKVQAEITRWVGFYSNSDKYSIVGKVMGQKEPTGRPPRLCAQALKYRPKRKTEAEKAAAAAAAASKEASAGDLPCES